MFKNKKKSLFFITILASLLILFTACSNDKEQAEVIPEEDEQVIIASTSWVATIARAAGAKDVTILAPVELRHPPEYDYSPSDIDKLGKADYVIYAGYEPFMNNLLEAVEIPEDKLLQVSTVNVPDNLRQQALELAEVLDTMDEYEAWLVEFDEAMEKIAEEAEKVNGKKAVVQMHMVAMAELMGFEVVGEFSEDLSPEKSAELANLDPEIIIDNYHNVQGEAIAEIAEVDRVELRNFPATEDQMIQDLMLDNAKLLGLDVD